MVQNANILLNKYGTIPGFECHLVIEYLAQIRQSVVDCAKFQICVVDVNDYDQ